MNEEMIDELKHEEGKYRKLYESGVGKNFFLEGLKADAFKLAISRIESKGLVDTYLFLKSERDVHLQSNNKLGRNLGNAFGLVVGKLWKYYKKVI